ncbi:MAG TPA: cyclic nucleotide-binding domain-containing protein, partial [Cyclobacteriaceae bacterium]|nr:cyclic nucleotide-binding domain-containing protein [Cyclobacteriaceae bacterium]
ETIAERLPFKDKKFLDSSIENNQLLDGLDDGFFLGIEMVMFIKEMPAFKGIEGNLLADLADKIMPVNLKPGDKVAFDSNLPSPILITAHGQVTLKSETAEVMTLKRGEIFGDLFMEGVTPQLSELVATEQSVVFRISVTDFYFVLANHHELVQGLIKNSSKKIESAFN